MEEYYLRNDTDLPNPGLKRRLTLDDESASKSGHNTLHLFKLPKIGDYLWNFRLASHALVKSSGNPGERWSHNPTHHVESILDYVEAVHFCVGSPENSVAWIENGLGSTTYQHRQRWTGPASSAMHCDAPLDLGEVLCADLPFFGDMPLIGAGLTHEDLYIGIKFSKAPPMKYFIDYETGFLADQAVINRINEGLVRCETRVLRGVVYEPKVLNYQFGKLTLS